MKYAKVLGLLLLALVVAGCSAAPSTDGKDKDKNKENKHTHGKGPNGGVVFDFGKYHGEFTVDHDKKECTLYILGSDEKTPVAIAGKDLTVHTEETKTTEGKVVPKLAIKLQPTPAGEKASKFVGTDPGLGNVAEFAGRVVGEIDGKGANGKFKEE